jgi:hypothetical protein
MGKTQSDDEMLDPRREELDAQIARMLEAIRVQRKELADSLNRRKPGREAKLKRLRHDQQMEIAADALGRIHERVWNADEDTLDLIRDALLVPYALLTLAERDSRTQKGRVLGANAKAGNAHPNHYEWKEIARQLQRRDRKRYATGLSWAKAIKDGRNP